MNEHATTRCLSVSFQADRARGADTEELVAKLRAVADGALLSLFDEVRGLDNGPYVNLTYTSPDHVTAWSKLQALFEEPVTGPQLAASTIVVCEGQRSWDDYLLLHHFDPHQALDDVRVR